MTVKVGDRVKVTKGKQCIIGLVDFVTGVSVFVKPDTLSTSVQFANGEGWKVEILPPPIPAGFDKPGALVLDDNDDVWQKQSDGLWDCISVRGLGYRSWTFDMLSENYELRLLSVTKTLPAFGRNGKDLEPEP